MLDSRCWRWRSREERGWGVGVVDIDADVEGVVVVIAVILWWCGAVMAVFVGRCEGVDGWMGKNEMNILCYAE